MKKINSTTLMSMEQSSAGSSNPAKKFPILAFDYGQKMSGLAWSPDGMVVFPIEVIDTTKAHDVILELYASKKCKQLVIGLPISGDGSENNICKTIRDFSRSLGITDTVFVNERNSSQAVIVREKSNKPKPRIDDLAAARILEFWLEQK